MILTRVASALVVLLPAIAAAQTLSVEADRPFYLVGEVVTLTVTGDSAGIADFAIGGALTYSPALTRTVQASQTPHTSNNGAQAWTLGPLSLRDGRANVFNQICCFSPQSVDQLQIATVRLIAEAPGDVAVSFAPDLYFFGLTSAPGTTFTILPNLSIPPPLPNVPPSPGPSAPFAGGPSGSLSSYLLWPEAAELGETVGVLLDAPAAVDFSPETGPVEVDPVSFQVHLTHMDGANSFTESVQPRAALEAPAALTSRLVDQNGGSWTGVLLLFDLPAVWTQSSLTYGTDQLLVAVAHDGQTVFDGKALLVMGNGGSPLSPGEFESIGTLAQRPMLRLRPSWDATASEGFDPAWNTGGIGAVEVVLHFTEPASGGTVENPSVTVNGDAAGAIAYVETLVAPSGEKRWRLSVVSPDGVAVADKGCVGAGDCYAGRWTLLDLAFDKVAGVGQLPGDVVFSPSDFAIEDVVVLDSDGVPLNTAFAGETYFRLHAVNNLVESTLPPPTPSPILAWPKRAYLGDTVAVLFNSEADTAVNPDEAYLDADGPNVEVHVDDPDGHRWTDSYASVVELPAALGSEKVGAPPESQTGVIAFFELPDPWGNSTPGYSLPAPFAIEVEYQGAATSGVASVEILGIGGSAIDFTSIASLDDLAKDDLLRLRPVWNESASPEEGFDPSWEMGAVEFELRYTQAGLGEVTGISALANGEAIAGLATATRLPDEGTDKLWGIRLVAPDGFGLPDAELGSSGASPVGRWSLLDLRVEAQANGAPESSVFTAGEFAIEDLKAFGLDGTALNPTHQGEPFFEFTTVLPEPGAFTQFLAGVLGVGLLGARRRRNRTGAEQKARSERGRSATRAPRESCSSGSAL